MRIVVNGEERMVADDLTVAGLVDELALSQRRVAVEVNKQLVPRAQHPGHALAEGDAVEIVTLVGGG